jgi:hypothetical protein
VLSLAPARSPSGHDRCLTTTLQSVPRAPAFAATPVNVRGTWSRKLAVTWEIAVSRGISVGPVVADETLV